MNALVERFRKWYDYERDCNAKALAMLESVPPDRRETPQFQKAVDKLAHLIAARQRWLFRLGRWPSAPGLFPKGSLENLPASLAETEAAWLAYYNDLDEAELRRAFEYEATEGNHYRWDVEGMLTQLFGHAWYHRGQIAHLVAELGGKAVDTDYVFWAKPERVDIA
jgi:uncharacterized damage-inducible protein DinB